MDTCDHGFFPEAYVEGKTSSTSYRLESKSDDIKIGSARDQTRFVKESTLHTSGTWCLVGFLFLYIFGVPDNCQYGPPRNGHHHIRTRFTFLLIFT